MSSDIFRKVALERLSTPDQLDQALLLTPSAGRFALYCACALVTSIIVASVLISVPIMASGVGIVLQEQGVSEVVAVNGGRVVNILVGNGDAVAKGQLLAELAQPDLETSLETTQADILDLQTQRARILDIHARDQKFQSRQRNQQRNELTSRLSSAKLRLAWLEQRLKQDQALVGNGYLSQNKLKDTEAEGLQIRDQIAHLNSQLRTLDADDAASAHARERETLNIDVRIANLTHRASEIKQKLARDSRLYSSQAGIVAETKIGVGDVLSSGQSIMSLLLQDSRLEHASATHNKKPRDSQRNKDLQVVAYLSAGEGKKVRPGMAIRVTPSNVKKEEFGSIIGKVVSVEPFPATAEGMQRTLRNRQLVQTLSQDSAPIEVRLALTPDLNSASGLRWTSRGPAQKLEAGTTVQAEVVVKRMRLLVLALPALEGWLHVEPDA